MPAVFPNQTKQESFVEPLAVSLSGAAKALRLWHLTSLDAPTVALAWAFSFAWAAGVKLPWLAAAVIALGVWTVYLGDRLLDARSALRSHTEERLRERHYFHWRHRRILVPLASIAGAAVAVLVLACVPMVARERDSVLAAASLAYFARVHQSQLSARRGRRPFLPPVITKELLVGVLFAVGCALPALGAAWAVPVTTRWELIACVVLFAALAWLNCHAIERWEENPHGSGRLVRRSAYMLAAIAVIGAAMIVHTNPRAALLMAGAGSSALYIAILDRLRSRIAAVTLRAAADLVLLAPAGLIAIAGVLQ